MTGWTAANAEVWFEIAVMTAGEYEVEIAFACPADDAGSRVRLSVDDTPLEFVIPAATAPEIRLSHRDEKSNTRYRNCQWSTLKLGTLKLTKGPVLLTIRPFEMPGTQAMEFKHVTLQMKPQP